MGQDSDIKLLVDGKRLDGRSQFDLRNIRIEAGILHDADGSAFVEWGKNKVICGIYGPRECIPRHEASPYKALVKCRYSMAPFSSLEEHSRSGPSRRSVELSKVIREVFENLIITESFPRTQINIFVDVLQSDGGTRTTCITAAAVALANAGIPMRDMASAVAVGKADDILIADLAKEEDNFGQCDMPVAFSYRKKDILLLQMDGLLTREEIETLLNEAEKASDKVYAKQFDALKKVYESPEENFKM
ncbi:exosome complex exonuclease Rrp41 [Candidatus Micrarchaeota archaeon]|nr:exosome complex exonuclease Rrp41 [Candidatus Micrarchaeota archaeon]